MCVSTFPYYLNQPFASVTSTYIANATNPATSAVNNRSDQVVSEKLLMPAVSNTTNLISVEYDPVIVGNVLDVSLLSPIASSPSSHHIMITPSSIVAVHVDGLDYQNIGPDADLSSVISSECVVDGRITFTAMRSHISITATESDDVTGGRDGTIFSDIPVSLLHRNRRLQSNEFNECRLVLFSPSLVCMKYILWRINHWCVWNTSFEESSLVCMKYILWRINQIVSNIYSFAPYLQFQTDESEVSLVIDDLISCGASESQISLLCLIIGIYDSNIYCTASMVNTACMHVWLLVCILLGVIQVALHVVPFEKSFHDCSFTVQPWTSAFRHAFRRE